MSGFFKNVKCWMCLFKRCHKASNISSRISEIFLALLTLNDNEKPDVTVFYIVFQKLLNDALEYCVAVNMFVKHPLDGEIMRLSDVITFVQYIQGHIPRCTPYEVIEEIHPGLVKTVLELPVVREIIETSWDSVQLYRSAYVKRLEAVRKGLAELMTKSLEYKVKLDFDHKNEIVLQSDIIDFAT